MAVNLRTCLSVTVPVKVALKFHKIADHEKETREKFTKGDVLSEMIDLYEEKHGLL